MVAALHLRAALLALLHGEHLQGASRPANWVTLWHAACLGLPASRLRRPADGSAVQLLMNIPFTALYFATYESSKKILGRTDEDEGLLVQVIAGLLLSSSSSASVLWAAEAMMWQLRVCKVSCTVAAAAVRVAPQKPISPGCRWWLAVLPVPRLQPSPTLWMW